MKMYNRSKIFTLAHQIKRQFDTFSSALKAAWRIIKMKMGESISITFAKSTGELRTAQAVAVGSLSTIEKGFVRFVEQVSEDKTQWRSFRLERLVF